MTRKHIAWGVMALLLTTLMTGPVLAKSRAARKVKAPAAPTMPGLSSDSLQDVLLSSGVRPDGASALVVSLESGKALFEFEPDQALNPASNMKVLTAAAALEILGADYTFKTFFYSLNTPENGVLDDVWIRGTGDPFFVTQELQSLAQEWRASGVKEIRGNLYMDDLYFDQQDEIRFPASSGRGVTIIHTNALSCNFNSFRGGLAPSRKKGKKSAPRSKLPRDPACFTGEMIRQALNQAGILVRGQVEAGAVPEGAKLIYEHNSPPLSELLRALGKYSNNFSAEQILKALGAARYGPPGSTNKGLSALAAYLRGSKIPDNDYNLDNGSGLSHHNRLSARHLVTILQRVWKSKNRQVFLDTLSIGGEDGTLRRSFHKPPLYGNVHAKTGTLGGVRALSGFLLIPDQEPIAFSFLFNDNSLSVDRIKRVEEAILTRIANRLAHTDTEE